MFPSHLCPGGVGVWRPLGGFLLLTRDYDPGLYSAALQRGGRQSNSGDTTSLQAPRGGARAGDGTENKQF